MAALPNRIPPQTAPFFMDNGSGGLIVETGWYLFLYNLSSLVLSASGGGIPLPPSVNLALEEVGIASADVPQAYRQALNAALAQPEADGAGYATLRDLANVTALVALAVDAFDATPVDAMSLKGIQRGVIILTAGNTSASATLSPSVDTTKTELRFLGAETDATTITSSDVYVQLVGSNTVTAFRAGSANTVAVSWETTEYK